jgi:hypothetical protein
MKKMRETEKMPTKVRKAKASFETVERVIFRGTTYTFVVKEFPVADLKLDPHNPRFAHRSAFSGKALSQQDMEDEIWLDPRTKEDLYNSIKANGVLEKLWIYEDGRVFEGNQRRVVLGQLREKANKGELRDEGIEPGAFDTVLCVICPKETPPELIRRQMGIWHIGQKKAWPAAAEAKFIYEAIEKGGLGRIDQIAADFSRSAPYLVQKKWAYERMKEFVDWARKNGKRAEESQYSFFEELYKQRRDLSDSSLPIQLVQARADSSGGPGAKYQPVKSEMPKLYEWIVGGRFDSEGAKGLRDFADILRSPRALEAFKTKSIRAARRVVEDQQPGKSDPKFSALSAAVDALKSINSEGLVYKPGSTRFVLLKELDVELHKVIKLSDRLKGAA